MTSGKRPPPGKHKMNCPFCGRVVFVEFTATDTTSHHQAPVCEDFRAKAMGFGTEETRTPAKDVYRKFGN